MFKIPFKILDASSFDVVSILDFYHTAAMWKSVPKKSAQELRHLLAKQVELRKLTERF